MNLTGDAPASQRSQGTCCGSDPKVGLSSWLDAGGVGIDTANDYNDQNVIGDILNPYIAKQGLQRSDFFITTKVPAGFGGAAACKAVRQWVATTSVDALDVSTRYVCFAGSQRLAEHTQTEPAAAQNRLRRSGATPQTMPDCRAKQCAMVSQPNCATYGSLRDLFE